MATSIFRKSGTTFIAVALAVLPLSAGANGLSLNDALDQAFSNSPVLQAASRLGPISQGELEQARLLPNPELSWELEDTRSGKRTTTLQISQPLELGGKRGARVALAARGRDIAALEFERSGNALRGEVIQGFYKALHARTKVELAQESLALAENGVTVARRRVESGRMSPVELTRAQVQHASVRIALSGAIQERAGADVELRRLLGMRPVADELVLEGDAQWLPVLPENSSALLAVEQSVELRLARLEVDRQVAAMELESRQRIPNLSLSLGSQYSAETGERINLIGLSAPLPLFDRNQGNLLAASQRAEQARDLRNDAEWRLRAEVQQTLDLWRLASEQAAAYRETILPSAQKAVDSATRGFEMGKFEFMDVLDAQRTLIDARTGYVESLAQGVAAWARIEQLFGDVLRLSANAQP